MVINWNILQENYHRPSNVFWGGNDPEVCTSLAASPRLCTCDGRATPATDVGSYTEWNALAFIVSFWKIKHQALYHHNYYKQ